MTVGVSTLSPVPRRQTGPARCHGRALREVAGALGHDQDQGTTATDHEAALQ
jgi:hypothetical protein